jgi:hypothetical protein
VTDYRAGTASILGGTSAIVVTMSSALPSANYEVVVTPTNTAGIDWGTNNDCVYWNVGTKTTTTFTITQYKCGDGALRLVRAGTTLTLGWIAIANN